MRQKRPGDSPSDADDGLLVVHGNIASGFLLSLGVVALFLWLGIAYFRGTERRFADLI